MISSIDKAFAFQEKALALRGYRQQVLASNIANADTPNYKAMDIDFASACIRHRCHGGVEWPGRLQAIWMARVRRAAGVSRCIAPPFSQHRWQYGRYQHRAGAVLREFTAVHVHAAIHQRQIQSSMLA